MRKKGFLAAILAVLLIVGLSISAWAVESSASAITVTGPEEIKPGQEFTVTLDVANNPGVISMVLDVHYTEGLTLVSAQDMELLSDGIMGSDYTANPYCVGWIMTGATEDVYTNGTLAKLTFKLDASAQENSTHKIWVEYNPENVFDKELDNMTFETVGYTYTVPAKETEPSETTKPTDATEPSETTKPTDATEPSETTKPTDATEPSETTKPTDATEPSETTKPTDATDSTESTTPPSTTPETGDNSHIGMFVVLMIVSVIAMTILGYLWIRNRKLFNRVLSILLVTMLLGGMMPVSTRATDEVDNTLVIGTAKNISITAYGSMLLSVTVPEGASGYYVFTGDGTALSEASVSVNVSDDNGWLNDYDWVDDCYYLEAGSTYAVSVLNNDPNNEVFLNLLCQRPATLPTDGVTLASDGYHAYSFTPSSDGYYQFQVPEGDSAFWTIEIYDGAQLVNGVNNVYELNTGKSYTVFLYNGNGVEQLGKIAAVSPITHLSFVTTSQTHEVENDFTVDLQIEPSNGFGELEWIYDSNYVDHNGGNKFYAHTVTPDGSPTEITVKCGDVVSTNAVAVTVKDIEVPITDISFTTTSQTQYVNEEFTVDLQIEPSNGIGDLEWIYDSSYVSHNGGNQFTALNVTPDGNPTEISVKCGAVVSSNSVAVTIKNMAQSLAVGQANSVTIDPNDSDEYTFTIPGNEGDGEALYAMYVTSVADNLSIDSDISANVSVGNYGVSEYDTNYHDAYKYYMLAPGTYSLRIQNNRTEYISCDFWIQPAVAERLEINLWGDVYAEEGCSVDCTVFPEYAKTSLEWSTTGELTGSGTGEYFWFSAPAATGEVGSVVVKDTISGATATLPITVVARPAAKDFLIRDAKVTGFLGEMKELIVDYTPSESRVQLTWTSSDPEVVAIRDDGLLELLKEGTATITASATIDGAEKTSTSVVTVMQRPEKITGITFEKASVAYVGAYGGDSAHAHFSPYGFTETDGIHITVTSSDPEIVEVDSEPFYMDFERYMTGVNYRCKKPGTATITMTVDGTDVSGSMTVTITEEIPWTDVALEIVDGDTADSHTVTVGKSVLVKVNRTPLDANTFVWLNDGNGENVLVKNVQDANGVITHFRIYVNGEGEHQFYVQDDNGNTVSNTITLTGVAADEANMYDEHDVFLHPGDSQIFAFTPETSGYYVFHTTGDVQNAAEMSITNSNGDPISTVNSTGGAYGCGAYLEAENAYRLYCTNTGKTNFLGAVCIENAKVPTTVSIVPTDRTNLLNEEDTLNLAFDSVEHYGAVSWNLSSSVADMRRSGDQSAVLTMLRAGRLTVSAALENGTTATYSVTIKADTELDVDMDGALKPTQSDVSALCEYIVGVKDVNDIDSTAADINAYGGINAKDAVVLARHIEE